MNKHSKQMLFSGLIATALALVAVGGPHAVKADSVSGSTLAASSLNIKATDKKQVVGLNQTPDKSSENNTVLINGKSLKKESNHMLPKQTQNQKPKVATKASESVDSWMPDKNLQRIVAYNLYSKDSPKFMQKINKQDLSQLTTLRLTGDYERTHQDYYSAALNIESLEGLQYATNLEVLDLSPDIDSNINFFGTAYWHSHLQDISALKNLNKLTDVYMEMCSIYDISALSNKPKLKNLGISYNGVTDFSPLKTDTKLPTYVTAYYQTIFNPQIEVSQLRPYITATYNFKDIDSSNMPIRIANDEDKDYYVSNYLSDWKNPGTILADGKTVEWDLSKLPVGYKGYMTVNYEGKFLGEPGYESGGWLIIPFVITAN
ncbi:hypothetical protein [Lactobacillus sp. ESL0261]|uniref:hypothetical protein n=1 Tax=Lactobacillus sp. ESL0261 TaxID=2069348 RepID=UPI000EFBD220|nr:hypothetical protein [Lactobacillus sp. ESL0261]RMC52950.1 hypothetical protein F5ESL0261_09345 [Lactobacillus sp. ESL0261]